ncbi:MAG TPA: hypothetical protein VI030_03385 [Propionibacteriaceae bacterium]
MTRQRRRPQGGGEHDDLGDVSPLVMSGDEAMNWLASLLQSIELIPVFF